MVFSTSKCQLQLDSPTDSNADLSQKVQQDLTFSNVQAPDVTAPVSDFSPIDDDSDNTAKQTAPAEQTTTEYPRTLPTDVDFEEEVTKEITEGKTEVVGTN